MGSHDFSGYVDRPVVAGWDEWTECSKSCDKGVQSRMKYCNNLPCRSLEAICNAMPCYGKSVTTCYVEEQRPRITQCHVTERL